MLNASLYNYNDLNILVSGTITVPNKGAAASPSNRENIIIKNCVPFTDCINEINNTQIDNAKHTDIVIPMYNLIEHSDNYSKTSRSSWQYNWDEPFLNANGAITEFSADNNNIASFKCKVKIAGTTENDGRKLVKTMVSWKYFSN